MDSENMDKFIKKQLMMAMMIGEMAQKQRGINVNKETKLMVGEDEFHYEGRELNLKEETILALGVDEKNQKSYRVLDFDTRENTVKLEEVVFFKARVTNGQGLDEFCVIGTDRTNASQVLKDYCLRHGYTRVVSLNPSKFFKPFIE